MPAIDTETTIKQYFESVKDQYPHIDFNSFEFVCKSPFKYFAEQMKRPEMPRIIIKYLGKFQVFSGRIRTLINKNDVDLKFEKITPEEHQERNNKYNEKLNQLLQYEESKKIHRRNGNR